MFRTVLGALIGAVIVLAPASPAVAAGWSPPRQLPADWHSASIGFDGTGVATAAHTEIVSTAPVLTRSGFSVRRADGSWEQQATLPTRPDFFPTAIELAVARNGAAVACIEAIDGDDVATAGWFKAVAYRPAGTASWSEPVRVGSVMSDYETAACMPQITPTGFAAVLVGYVSGGVQQLTLATHPAGGSWTTQLVGTAGIPAESGRIALDDAGNATVAWRHRWNASPERFSVRVKTRMASTGVLGSHSALTPESGTASAFAPELATNAAGQSVLALQLGLHLSVAIRPSSTGAWSALSQIFTDATASSSNPRAVGVSPSGMAHVVYYRQGPGSSANSVTGTIRRNVSFGNWTAHAPLSPPGSMVFEAGVAYLGETAFPVLAATIGGGGGDPGTGILQGSQWAAFNPTPDPGTDLVTPGPAARLTRVLPDHAGNVAILHADPISGSAPPRLLLSAYDATPPVLTEAAVPEAVTVGTAVQLRSAFADLYSPVDSVTWDFGDGTPPGNGPTVTHAWAAPGPYTVTATARDAAGNQVSRSFAVTAAVAAPPAAPPTPPGAPHAALDVTRPVVKLTRPACKKRQKKAACNAMRKRAASWKTVRGSASDDTGLARVQVTAVRKKTKKVKAKTIRATATVKGAAWSARLKGLGKGTWTITAVASDAAGNSRSAKRTVTLR